jgi:hypothetical protein
VFQKGQDLYNDGSGTELWKGNVMAPQSGDTTNALDMTRSTANAMSPFASMGMNAASGMIGGNGLSSAMDGGLGTLGGMAGGGTATRGFVDRMAPETAASSFMTPDGSTNPWLKAQLDANSERIGNRMSSAMSGSGRYGSFGHGDAMGRSIAEANNPLLSAAYESDMNRGLQAAGMQDAMWNAGEGRRLQAAGMQDQTMMNAANSQLGFLGQGMDRKMSAMGMMPQLNELAYDPANRLAAVGAVGDQRAQTELDYRRQLFDQEQNMDWGQLGKYSASLSGLSGLVPNTGNSTTTTNGGSSGAAPFIGGALSLLSL